MKYLIIIYVLSISQYVGASVFPGTEPDCWTKLRAVHTYENTDDHILNHVSISKDTEAPSKQLDYVSPNNGYSFSVVNGRPNSKITVSAEKNHITVIELENIFGVTQVKWVNENLVFFRTYLGQEVFIDILFNVESELIELALSGRYPKSAIHQYELGCKLHGGCVCIKK